jgi:hypothetical protein
LANTYNAGLGGVSKALRNGLDTDTASTNKHYGSTIVALTKCF